METTATSRDQISMCVCVGGGGGGGCLSGSMCLYTNVLNIYMRLCEATSMQRHANE